MASKLKKIAASNKKIFSHGISSENLRHVLKNKMLKLGDAPVAARNSKLEDTWKMLLSDAPVNYSDYKQFRGPSPDVRPSGFPFCPRRYTMERLGHYMPDTFDVKACVYTAIGTAYHAVAQNALARTGRLWGLWECARPGCEKMWSKKPGFNPPEESRCKDCGCQYFNYHELTVEDKEVGLRGHVDGVMVYKDHTMILEIKTTGDEKIEKFMEMSDSELAIHCQTESPFYGYLAQASTYASLIREKYPQLPPIRGINFVIFSRDKPDGVFAFNVAVPQDDHWWSEIKSRIHRARRARDLRILPVGFATSEEDLKSLPSCRFCLHKDTCLTSANRIPDLAGDELLNPELAAQIDAVPKPETKATK